MNNTENDMLGHARAIAVWCKSHSCEDCLFLEIINVDIHTSMAPVMRCALVNREQDGESKPHAENAGGLVTVFK